MNQKDKMECPPEHKTTLKDTLIQESLSKKIKGIAMWVILYISRVRKGELS